jgi:Zn-dependent metalloprotease
MLKITNTAIQAVLLLFCLHFPILAQQTDKIATKLYADNGVLLGVEFRNAAQQPAVSETTALLFEQLQPASAVSFKLIEQNTDNLGYLHQAYQQYYADIKVENAIYLVHSYQNKIYLMNGDYRHLQKINTKPQISHDVAYQKFIGQAKPLTTANKEQHKPEKEELVIYANGGYKNSLTADAIHALCYKFRASTNNLSAHEIIYVDAHNGKIVDKISTICHTQKPTSVTTIYSGLKTVTIDSVLNSQGNHDFFLVDSAKNIETRDALQNNLLVGSKFSNFSDLSTFRRSALDAFWGASVTYNYWQSVHQRQGHDGQNGKLTILMHDEQSEYDGGRYHDNSIRIGNPYTYSRNFTCLDIIGHEYGHGITRFSVAGGTDDNNGLVYQGESGAMNESFSDIWGACIDSRNGKNPWLHNEEIGTVRSLSNPNNFSCPDTYKGRHWATNIVSGSIGSVHINSSVMNHWFYLLSVGGTGTNDNNHVYNVTGITIFKAEQIAYRTYNYLTPNSQYNNLPLATLQATKDIHGICSQEYESVWNALYAVGLLYTPYVSPYAYMINTSQIVCSPNLSYLFSVGTKDGMNAPLVNIRYRWSLAIGGRLLLNGTSGNIITTTPQINMTFMTDFGSTNTNGYWETLTVTPLDCNKSRPVSYRFWVGKPDVIGELSSVSLCAETPNQISVAEVAGTEEYIWYVNPNEATIDAYANNTNDISITPINQVNFVTLFLMVRNSCSNPRTPQEDKDQNTYRWRVFLLPVAAGKGCNVMCNNPKLPCLYFVGFPNPATSTYTITTKGDFKEQGKITPYSYKIYNSMGVNMTENNSEDGADKQLDVSTWADGLYVIQLQSVNINQYLKFVVQKGSVAN